MAKVNLKGENVVEETKVANEQAPLTYEQLKNIASQMNNQLQELYQENQQLKAHIQNQGGIVRMEFLFNVLDKSEFFDKDFIGTVTNEIKASLYPTPVEETTNPTE